MFVYSPSDIVGLIALAIVLLVLAGVFALGMVLKLWGHVKRVWKALTGKDGGGK